jgi:hypothetical protein
MNAVKKAGGCIRPRGLIVRRMIGSISGMTMEDATLFESRIVTFP